MNSYSAFSLKQRRVDFIFGAVSTQASTIKVEPIALLRLDDKFGSNMTVTSETRGQNFRANVNTASETSAGTIIRIRPRRRCEGFKRGPLMSTRIPGATWLVGTAMLTGSLANRVQGKGFVREWRSNGIRFYRWIGEPRGSLFVSGTYRAFTTVRGTIRRAGPLASGFPYPPGRRSRDEGTESTIPPRSGPSYPIRSYPPSPLTARMHNE